MAVTSSPSFPSAPLSKTSLSSAAPPPPMDQGRMPDFGVSLAVGLVCGFVLYRDIRRVGDHGVILAGLEYAAEFVDVLALVVVRQFVETQDPLARSAVKQRIATGQVEPEAWDVLE